MKTLAKRIVDRYPHLQDGIERRQMLVRNAVGSARVEGSRPDEVRLQETLFTALTAPVAAPPQ